MRNLSIEQLRLIKFAASFLMSNLTEEVQDYMQISTLVLPEHQEADLKQLLREALLELQRRGVD